MHRILLDFAIEAEGRKVGKERIFSPLLFACSDVYFHTCVYILYASLLPLLHCLM